MMSLESIRSELCKAYRESIEIFYIIESQEFIWGFIVKKNSSGKEVERLGVYDVFWIGKILYGVKDLVLISEVKSEHFHIQLCRGKYEIWSITLLDVVQKNNVHYMYIYLSVE